MTSINYDSQSMCTQIGKNTKEEKPPCNIYCLEQVGCSCLVERWDGDLCITLSRKINSHASEEGLAFLLPHTPQCLLVRVYGTDRDFLMVGNFHSVTSGTTCDLWVWVFSPILTKIIGGQFSWFKKIFLNYLLNCWLRNIRIIPVAELTFNENIHFSDLTEYTVYISGFFWLMHCCTYICQWQV